MKEDALIKQSKTAYTQWAAQWREHAKQHSQIKQKSLKDFENTGIGKAILLVANGYSLEEEIQTIKENQHNVDILCCDKSLGHLISNGIKPKYCLVCDANVDYERYMKPWENQLDQTVLFINVCGNPKWTFNGNWKDRYCFVNKDVILSEKEFSQLSNCNNFIPAGTNVSNAMVVFVCQSDNEGRKNFFGYDKILLIGFDYSWRADGNYYAFNHDGDGKRNYMCHAYFDTITGKRAYSSGNLVFSKDWLQKYISTFGLPVIQCAKDSLLQLKHTGNLKHQITYKYKPDDAKRARLMVAEYNEAAMKAEAIRNNLIKINKDHWNKFLTTV